MVERRNEHPSSRSKLGSPRRQHARRSARANRGGPPRLAGLPGPLLLGPLLLGSLLIGCAGGGANASDRYPEERRPGAPISASDGEVLGAHEQNPADTLEGSLTNEHGAARSPHAEEPAEEAHERLDYQECVEANQQAIKAAATPGAEARKKPVCPPPSNAGQ